MTLLDSLKQIDRRGDSVVEGPYLSQKRDAFPESNEYLDQLYAPEMVDKLLKDKTVGYASVIRKPGSFAIGDFDRLNLSEAQKRKM